MSEVAKSSPKEQTELTELLSEVRQIETQLKILINKISEAIKTTWRELLDVSIVDSEMQTVKNLEGIISLNEEARQLHNQVFELNQRINAGSININPRNDIEEDARNELPSIVINLLHELGQIRMDTATCIGELQKVSSPARQIRLRISEILKISVTGTDDLILNKQPDDEGDGEGHGVGF